MRDTNVDTIDADHRIEHLCDVFIITEFYLFFADAGH
jgi:hypothetical protein